jgi:hypothetical protein
MLPAEKQSSTIAHNPMNVFLMFVDFTVLQIYKKNIAKVAFFFRLLLQLIGYCGFS